MSYVTLAFSQATSGVLGRSTVVGGLLLDAATSEELVLESDVTDHEVEDGFGDMSDHIKHRPNQLSITGLIGDTSLAILPSAADLMAGAVSGLVNAIKGGSWKDNSLTNPFGSSMSKSDLAGARDALASAKRLPSSGRSRLMQAMATLIAARDLKEPVAVVTGMQYYRDYYITSVRFSRSNADTGGMLSVSVGLRTIRIVDTELGTLEYPTPQKDKTKGKSSKTAANKGKANQKPASPATQGEVEAAIYAE